MITFVCGVVGILLGLILLVKDITKTSDEALKMHSYILYNGEQYFIDGDKRLYVMRNGKKEYIKGFIDEQHPWIDGDCCRCEICTEQFHDELFGDLETITDINHNLRNNK